MTSPTRLTHDLLKQAEVNHGFFGRSGGVSKGLYASLNCGIASKDEADAILENRKRVMQTLGGRSLSTAKQIHSSNVLFLRKDFGEARPEVDALVTDMPGVAVGALAADCMTVLMLEPNIGIIAAAHAGWRGALAGVLPNTVAMMKEHGAKAENIRAVFGPCLRQENFEVGLDLVAEFAKYSSDTAQFFAPGINDLKRQFDIVGFGHWQLEKADLNPAHIGDTGSCTLGNSEEWFSYRGSKLRQESDYGRHISAICLG